MMNRGELPLFPFSALRFTLYVRGQRSAQKEGRMIMQTIQIDLPDEILLSLKETPEGLSREIRMAVAAKLYELGKLSSGRAAELVGVPRVSFLQALARYGVSILDLTEEELEQDLRNA
jgi:predicted HTH domain antitoxin